MKLALIGLICAVQSSNIIDSSILYLLKTHCRQFPESGCNNLLHIDSAMVYEPFVEFPINEHSDTIYIVSNLSDKDRTSAFIFKRGYGLSIFDGVWRKYKFQVEVKDDKFFKKYGNYYELLSKWETKTLKQIGYEQKVAHEGYPYTVVHYGLTRMILYNGHDEIDTTTYISLGDIEKFTREQLDSVRLRARTIGIPSETTSEEIVNDVSEKMQHQDKDSFQDNPKTVPPKSIWQRIADWFVSLWHSIFG